MFDEKKLIRRYCNNYGLDQTRITYDMIMHHWNLERQLTEKMRSCPADEHTLVFKECYHELYSSCPWLVPTGITESNSDNGMNW